MYLCRECFYCHYTPKPTPCPCCGSKQLTIPCSEALASAVEKLIERGIDVISSNCDTYPRHDPDLGIEVHLQIELGRLYTPDIFEGIPPSWDCYTYYTLSVDSQPCTGLSHFESFPKSKTMAEEAEFSTGLTISNLEVWLDDRDPKGFWSVWKLAGVLC